MSQDNALDTQQAAPHITSHAPRITPHVVLIWLAWAAILIGFQAVVPQRLKVQRPDYALFWTPNETKTNAQNNKPYLLDPFMNAQVSWDSEFYLAIATGGYDDPAVRAVAVGGRPLSLSYAFLPLYPYAMRAVAAPLRLVGMAPIPAATLAGVLLSLLGTLAGMLALYDLARDELAARGALRAAFYLVIFPMGFFLAQVYTEGLFVGLALSCLALIRRRRLVWAGVLAVLATWTRIVGVGLAIPLALAWWDEVRAKDLDLWSLPRSLLARAVVPLAPLAALVGWYLSPWGWANEAIEAQFFGRGFLLVDQTLRSWQQGLAGTVGNSEATVYYALEIAIIALAVVACLATLRRYPGVAWFGLSVLTLSFFSGSAQSVGRYAVVIPSLYLFLGRLGRHEAFDRAWTLVSVLVMGILAMLFTFDMWVA